MLSTGNAFRFDAHLHLQDERLKDVVGALPGIYRAEDVAAVVVNGTRPEDWPLVLQLAVDYPFVVPSFGLHPWFVNDASHGWQKDLLYHLGEADKLGRPVGVGECGLDKWIRGHDLEVQKHAFQWQLELAAERNLPLSIHCLKAWGSLMTMLKTLPTPERGFLLHSYGGPADRVEAFTELGAYFSFSGYFARADKSAKLEAFRRVPPERLLIETDAPDMLPPFEALAYPLAERSDGEIVNHPGNIRSVYQLAACCLNRNEAELTAQTAENFSRLFGTHSSFCLVNHN